MHILVIYDVSDNRRRRRIANLLNRYGTRVQRSAFECIVTETLEARLEKRLSAIIDTTDSVRIYFLSAARIRALGSESDKIYGKEAYLII